MTYKDKAAILDNSTSGKEFNIEEHDKYVERSVWVVQNCHHFQKSMYTEYAGGGGSMVIVRLF